MADESIDKPVLVQKTFNVSEMQHRSAENMVRIYANSASFGITFFDVSITFGQIVALDPGSMHIENRATVTMSLEHTMALADSLQRIISDYEKAQGPIRKTPPKDKI